MKLNDCNKAELIWIVEQAVSEAALELYLKKVDGKRAKMKEEFCKQAEETMREYTTLMAPYEGVDTM